MLVPVCGFYRWAAEEGHLPYDVAAYVRRPSRPRRSSLRWLTREQLNRLLRASRDAGPPVDGLVHLLALNGLRLTETLDARIEHLETRDGAPVLRLPSRKAGVMDVVGLPAPTIEVLAECIRGRQRGRILTTGGHALTPAMVYAHLDALSDVTGLDFRARPHMLRATFVTLSLDAGVPARDVMASTGHATTAMVDYYDRAHASARRNASHRLAAWVRSGHDESAPVPDP